MSRRFVSSPLTRGCAQLVQRWSEAEVSLLDVRRSESEKMASISATMAPRLDSLHGEEEDDEAEMVTRLDLL